MRFAWRRFSVVFILLGFLDGRLAIHALNGSAQPPEIRISGRGPVINPV